MDLEQVKSLLDSFAGELTFWRNKCVHSIVTCKLNNKVFQNKEKPKNNLRFIMVH
jgi:hypothetical protein